MIVMGPTAAAPSPPAADRLERQLLDLEPWIPRLVSRLRQHRLDHGDPEPLTPAELDAEARRLETWLADPSGAVIFNDPRLLELMEQQIGVLEPTGCRDLEGLSLDNIHDLAADFQSSWAMAEAARFARCQGWSLQPAPRFSSPRGLMIHGVGSGRYLARILERSQADVVLLFEPSFERLLGALAEVDLAALMAPFAGPGRAFFVITSRNSERAFEEATVLLTQSNLFVLDTLLVCDVDATEETARLQERFSAERNNMLIGYLGFFTDELHMLMNGTVTFRHLGATVIAPCALPALGGHAVIAASGPSLRAQLPLLAAERERYTLFCGWSTLGTLLEAGIVPDYHCPMERHAVHDALRDPAVARHLAAITLVGPASLDPRQLAPYAERLLVFRSASAVSALYAETAQQLIDGEGPITVNMAAIAAVLLGFRHLHFFGADFGTVDRSDTRMENALLTTPYSFNRTEPGVGGATVHTDSMMLDGRRALERLLEGWFTPGEVVHGHNFSQGLTIEGAPAANPSRFGELLGDGARQAAGPLGLPLRQRPWAEQRWRLGRLRQRCFRCLHTARGLVDQPFAAATLLAITDLANLHHTPLLDQLAARLYRGTIFRTWFGLLMLHRRLDLPDAAAEAAWLRHCRTVLLAVLDSLEALSVELFDYLEDLDGIDSFNFRSRLRAID